ncbi:MAG: amidohydrolase family protein [Lachnospiraceae bacterium]|nr:amidohydrolase family protein [Lachnospiraceae bacterium]
MMTTHIKNGLVWQRDSFCGQDLVIRDSHIIYAGPPMQPENGACVIDASGQYLLPGIIDCHAHVTMVGGSHHMATFFAENECELTLEGVINCEKMVRHGITSARDCGGKRRETFALRDFIRKGAIIGPRLLCSGTPLKVVGGHEPGFDITGPVEARRAARQFLYDGADFIKVMITGGLGKVGENPGTVEMELDEISAIVKEAHKHGKKVACHCHSRAGMEILLDAGADSIEHATYLDPEINERIIKQGVYVVPTFTPYEIAAASQIGCGILPDAILNSRAIIEEKRRRLKEAYEQGVPIAFGRDSGGFFMDQGEFADEMLYMQNAGMPAAAIIQSATENAAKCLGIWDETGSLEAGKSADILFLTKNPLEDLTAFRNALEKVCVSGKMLP